MRGRLFVFSGIDGAGKSTQIQLVASLLSTARNPPTVLWTRGGYTTGINLLKRVLRRADFRSPRRSKILPPSGPSQERTNAFSNPFIRKTWLTLAILDLIRVYALKVRWNLLWGNTVLCDRYHHDTQLDFELHFSNEEVRNWWLWRLMVAVSPKPDASFLLLVPFNVSQQRSMEKNEPFPTTDKILAARLSAYRGWESADEFADEKTWHVLDGTRPIDEVSQEIKAIIQSRCPDLHFEAKPAVVT